MFEGLFQPLHLIVVLLIALIVFGPGRLPEIGAGLGKSIRDFKKALKEDDKDLIEHTPGEKRLNENRTEKEI